MIDPKTTAGKTFRINTVGPLHQLNQEINGQEYRVEGPWTDVSGGQTWQQSADAGNFAAVKYAARAAGSGLPLDNNVVYGKVGSFGHLVHVSELVEI